MDPMSYQHRRNQVEQYFDRTAFAAWARLTSDAPVSRIRATVRAGRDRMRAQMLDALGSDLKGRRILDAGCGTGAMALALAQRGADVLAVDLSSQLIQLARERTAQEPKTGHILWVAGDMLDASFGHFDHVVAMDSLIHYEAADMARALSELAPRTAVSLHVSFAPRTPALAMMHWLGRCLPRSDRAPAIVPLAGPKMLQTLSALASLKQYRVELGQKVSSGFYISQLLHIKRSLQTEPVSQAARIEVLEQS